MAATRWTTEGRRILLAITVCAMVVSGCAQFNAPRIDPTGDRLFAEPLFAPAAAPTAFPPITTCPPVVANPTTPVAPPPTTTGAPLITGPPVSTDPQAATDPAYRDLPGSPRASDRSDVVVSPLETVAPVGSEVVVLAGVFGADSCLRTNERVEWMLAPGGAGQFVDLGKRTPADYLVGDFSRPRKIDNSFAVGSTSRRNLRLTRGTPNPTDDVYVRRGQAWITVTSPAEGVSRVTAYAPRVRTWERRKQTATIHWVDAQWSFPPPSINPAGSTHVLTTCVSRQTDGAPCIDWRVRYEILDGPAAGFAPDGAQAIEVATNEAGQASAEIFQQQPAAGTNRIDVQVIRPPVLGGGRPLVVGRGVTLKTWSAADIAVRKSGPAVASVGATLTYRIEVSNPGDLPAHDVSLTDVVPRGLTYLDSNPAGELLGQSVRWQLGTVSAGENRAVKINFRAERQGSFTNSAEAAAQGGLQAKASATTNVTESSVDVQVHAPEQTVNVGDEVTFRIVVTNRGQLPATGLMIKDHFDPGLEHAQAASPIERDLGSALAPGRLEAGRSQEIGVVLRVTKAGRLCNSVEVIGGGQVQATASACVTAVEPAGPRPTPYRPQPEPQLQPGPRLTGRGSMSVEMTGPNVCTVGEKDQFVVRVTNTGQEPLTEVRVVVNFDTSINPARATPGHVRENADLVWTVDTLAPSATEEFRLECDCLTAAFGAAGRVQVSSAEGAQAENRISVEIRAAPIAMPADLKMTIEDRHDPIVVGAQKTFIIRVVNNGRTPDRRVTLVVTLPPELALVKFATVGPPPTDYTPYGQIVRFDPVDTIAPGQTLEYRIRISAKQPGDVVPKAELTSETSRQGQTLEESTLVNPKS